MAASVIDYTKLSTWENLDSKETCLMISKQGEGCNPGAIIASAQAYTYVSDPKKRALFFFTCYTNGLCNSEFYNAYKNKCNSDISLLVRSVLKIAEVRSKVLSKNT